MDELYLAIGIESSVDFRQVVEILAQNVWIEISARLLNNLKRTDDATYMYVIIKA